MKLCTGSYHWEVIKALLNRGEEPWPNSWHITRYHKRFLDSELGMLILK